MAGDPSDPNGNDPSDAGIDGNPGSLGGNMSDAEGETSATLGGMVSDAQADANGQAIGLDQGLLGLPTDVGFPESFGFNTDASIGIPAMMANPDPSTIVSKNGLHGLLSALGLPSSIIGAITSGNSGQNAGQTTGAAIGSTIGSIAGPPGSVVGGIIGGMVGGNAIGGIPGMSASDVSAANAANSNPGNAAGGVMGNWLSAGAQGLASLYGYNQANKALQNQINSLSGMYGQNSPYAQTLREQLARRDAAAGRRSQYGPREVELQAQLARLAAGNANSIFQARQAQNQMRGQGLAALYRLGKSSGAFDKLGQGLQNLFGGGQPDIQLNAPAYGSGPTQSPMMNAGPWDMSMQPGEGYNFPDLNLGFGG